MKIDILTLFPDMYTGPFSESIIKRAREKTHGNVDDTPYGGGSGMVLMCQPIFDCINSLKKDDSVVIMMTPSGKVYNQEMAYDLSHKSHLIIICGHYEGFDERIRSICDMEISIGDYILTGGELPSMILTDSIVRLIPGAIDSESSKNESFNNNLLDYPVYTKPRIYNGMEVPEVLLSGNHAKIDEFRKSEQIRKTKEIRPDLLGDNYEDKV